MNRDDQKQGHDPYPFLSQIFHTPDWANSILHHYGFGQCPLSRHLTYQPGKWFVGDQQIQHADRFLHQKVLLFYEQFQIPFSPQIHTR